MTTKKAVSSPLPAEKVAAARARAVEARRQFAGKPGLSELLTPQELADAAPFIWCFVPILRS